MQFGDARSHFRSLVRRFGGAKAVFGGTVPLFGDVRSTAALDGSLRKACGERRPGYFKRKARLAGASEARWGMFGEAVAAFRRSTGGHGKEFQFLARSGSGDPLLVALKP